MPICVRDAVSTSLSVFSVLFAVSQSTSLQAASTILVIDEFRARAPNGGFDALIDTQRVSGGAASVNGWNSSPAAARQFFRRPAEPKALLI